VTAAFTVLAVPGAPDFAQSAAISAFATASFGGVWHLYTVSSATGGVAAFTLGGSLPATLLGEAAAGTATGSFGAADVAVTEVGGQNVLAVAGRLDDEFAYRRLDAAGGLSSFARIDDIPQSTAGLTHVEVAAFGATRLLVAAREDAAGIEVFTMLAGFDLAHAASAPGAVGALLPDVTGLLHRTLAGGAFVFAASAGSGEIVALSLGASGGLTLVSHVNAEKGRGIADPGPLAEVASGGREFLIVGGTGSSTLSVFEVGAAGQLLHRDTVWDDLSSRFHKVSAVEAIVHGGRAFVIAGGTDAGVTLFELDPTGRLHRLAVVEDTAATTLRSVTAIHAAQIGGEVQVFVASGNEPGFTHFRLDLGALGPALSAPEAGGMVTGTGADDLIIGGDGRDTLTGGAGQDRIFDGGGVDILTGGAGADIFVLANDGRYDRITDFARGIDRIDMSQIDGAYAASSLRIEPTATGARVIVGEEVLLVDSADGTPLLPMDLTAASFLF